MGAGGTGWGRGGGRDGLWQAISGQVWLLRWVQHRSQFALGVASELGCSLWHASLQGHAWPSGFPPGRDPGRKACGKSLVCLESYSSHLALSPQFWAGTQLQCPLCRSISLKILTFTVELPFLIQRSPALAQQLLQLHVRQNPFFLPILALFPRMGTMRPGWGPVAFIFQG